jgi:SAM-dependent methyltransferase
MNWLGERVQKEIHPEDTVLDLGCGIMQATTDSICKTKLNKIEKLRGKEKPQSIVCKSLLGCEIVDKYLDRAKKYFPVIKFDLNDMNSFDIFRNKSFDVVMALDVIEHIEQQHAIKIIGAMEKIARKKIIIYTPVKFEKNEQNIENAWDMGENPYQEHKCYIPPSRFESWGFKVSFPEPDKNTLAVKVVR